MRVAPGNAAAELARITNAIAGAESAIAGALAVATRAVGWTDSGLLPAMAMELIEVLEVDGKEGDLERNLQVRLAVSAQYRDRGLTGQHRHAAMARAVYLPYLCEAITPIEVTDAGATLQISGHRLYTDEARTSTIVTFDALLQIVVRVADRAAE